MIPTGNVFITTFVSPHLFWVINYKNHDRMVTIQKLNNLMQEICKKKSSSVTFEIGEVIAVETEDKLYRGLIKDKCVQSDSCSFICWLIDYGVMLKVENVFKLSTAIQGIPPLAYQICLNNAIYFKENLNFDSAGQAIMNNVPVLSPTQRSRNISMELLANCENLQFKLEKKEENIYFGDILYNDDGTDSFKSFKQYLIDNSVLMHKEQQMHDIKDYINSCKNNYMMLLESICYNIWNLLENVDIYSACDKLKVKYSQEFHYRDLTEDEKSIPQSRIKKCRSKNDINTSSDCPSTLETECSNKEISPTKMSKRTAFLELLKKQRDAQIHDQSIQTESLKQENNGANINSTSKNINSKKQLNEESVSSDEEHCTLNNQSMKSPKNASFNETGEDVSSLIKSEKDSLIVEKTIRKNVMFVPAGACHTLPTVKNVQKPKKKSLNLNSTSSENTSNKEEFSSEEFFSECEKKRASPITVDSTSEDGSSNNKENTTLLPINLTNDLKVKPHCDCDQCKHWTDESGWYKNHNFDKNKETKIKISSNEIRLSLFRDENDDTAVNIISLEYGSMTKMQKQTTPKLLIHCECLPTPVNDIVNINFHPEIHKNLKQLGYKKPKRIQCYVWPALFRNQHVFMIHGAQTGKSMAYLPVLCTFLLEKNERYDFRTRISGAPIIVILCSNTGTCEQIYDLIKILLGKSRTRVTLITYPISHINTNHIDLLVTTPLILVDLMKSKAVNLKRLCHLVIDDGDVIFRRYYSVIEKLLEVTQTMLSNRLQSKPVQLIVCAEHWNKHMSSLNERLKRIPMICIGNFMEAALYGKALFSIEFINSACKEQKLKSLIKETHRFCKSVIVCKEEEIECIQTTLMLKGIDATVISEDLSKEDILHLEEVWTKTKAGQYTVLVCSDFLLNTILSITCASLLIHYSLPSSWTQFVKRFSCLLENCNSPLQLKENKLSSKSVVLCDESCIKQMQKFFKYFHGVEFKNHLSNSWQECAKETQYLEEIEKIEKNVELCDILKLFGKCSNVHCHKRHTFCKDLDISKNLPSYGKIRFKIVNIHDVTKYSINLLQHVTHTNDVQTFKYNPNLVQDLSSVLRTKKIPVEKAISGHLYAIIICNDDSDDQYHRCELIDVNEENIKIKLIDEGSVINSFKTRLYELPKEFDEENEPRKLVEAYLANLVPPYEDENFSAKSFFNLKTMLDRVDYKKIIFSANVQLQLANTFWIKNVQENVDLSDKVISGFQLTRELLLAKLAVSNGVQLKNLYELCEKAGIQLPNVDVRPGKPLKEEKIEFQWAYLSMDNVEEVIFCSAVSPDEFYVRLNKFSDLLYTLEKEIQASLTAVNYPKLQEIKNGTICLAKDNEYVRAIVLKVLDEKALCFSVDFGHEILVPTTDLKFIHQQFIIKLPFQSICCRLYGLAPILDEWQADSLDTLYYYAVEPHTDIFRTLYVKVCSKGISRFSQNAYSVLMKDGFGEKKSLVNDLFINSGLARSNDEYIKDFPIPEMSLSDQTEDEDMETIKDICRKTEEVEENTNSCTKVKNNYFDENLELFCDDPINFFQELLVFSKNQLEIKNDRVFPPLQVAPKVDYCSPDLFWWQNENVVKISIRLPDVVDYKLTLTKGRMLNFRTVKDDKTYILKLMLYEPVDSMQHTSSGLDFKITLIKLKIIEWPRLILSKQRARNIHYDVTTIAVEEKKKKFLELPKEIDGNSNSDDDIDIMYHVVSDLDSDFDAEIEHDSDLL